MNTYNKQPADQLDYAVTFVGWIPEDDTITTVELSLDKIGELSIVWYENDGKIVKVWLAGGVNGSVYKVTVKVGTIGGLIKETEFRLRVKEL